MSTTNEHRRQIISKESLELLRENNIKRELINLDLCKELISKLKKEDTSSMNKAELHHHNSQLNLQAKKRKVLLERLLKLGYNADKRGRPRKDDIEKYKSTHTRITCYFTENNCNLLKDLKAQGEIENISAFLNELLGTYFTLIKSENIF